MERWKHSSNYMGADYTEYFMLIDHNRDSGILAESNWHSAIKILNAKNAKYQIVRFSHWAVGWIEMILIHQSEQTAIDAGNEIERVLSEYAVLNDEDFSNREWDAISELADQICADIANLADNEKLRGWSGIDKMMTRQQICDVICNSGMVQV